MWFGLAAFFVAAVTGTFVLSFNRAFGEDEVEHLYAAYTVGTGGLLYADIWQGHHPLLYWLLAPVMFDDDPVLAYRLARFSMLACLLGMVGIATFVARRLGGWQAAVWAPALLLLETTVANRGIEVRPDVPAALLVTGASALAVLLGPSTANHTAPALVLSLAFLFSKKAAVLTVPFGLLWCWHAWRDRRPGLLLAPLVVWAVPVVLAVLVLVFRGNLDDYLRLNVRDVADLTARTAVNLDDPPTVAGIALREWMRNLFFLPAGLVALALSARAARSDARLGFPTLLCVFGIGGLFLNPMPWAYNYLLFFPVLAALVGVWLARAAPRYGADRSSLRFAAAFTGVLALSALGSVPYLVEKADPQVQENQLRVLARIEAVTTPDEAVWDRMGLFFQPSGHWMYLLNKYHLLRFERGAAPYRHLEEELAANQVAVLVLNPRMRQLKRHRKAFRTFVDTHYVHESGNLLVAGQAVDLTRGQSHRLELFAPTEMAWKGKGSITVDGRRFLQGRLAAGTHTITSHSARSRGKLIRATPLPPPGTPERPSKLFINDGVPHVADYLSRWFPQ